MKNCAFLLLLVTLFATCSEDEVQRGIESYDSSTFIQFEQYISGNDLAIATDESLLIAGTGMPQGGTLGDPLLVKFNADKEIAWSTFLPDELKYTGNLTSVYATTDNQVLYLTNSENPDRDGEFGIDLSRMDASGAITWNRRIFEEGKNLISTSLVQLPGGDYIVLSEDEQTQEFEESNQMNLSRISATGQLVWSKLIEGSIVNLSRRLLYLPEEETIVTLNEGVPSFLQNGIYVHKFDLEGEVIWEKAIEESTNVMAAASDMMLSSDGDLLVAYSSDFDVRLVKIDTDGEVIWEKTFAGSETELVVEVIETDDDHFILMINTSTYGNGGYDVMLTKIDRAGETVWDKTYGSEASDQSRRLMEKSNGDLVVIGNSNETTGSDARFTLFVLETDSDGNPK